MPDSFFTFAILALLLTPGPTNTLLTVAAATRGLRASTPLLAGELLGYLAVIVPLATIAAPLLDGRPALAAGLRIAAACWVLFLAVRLWRVSSEQKAERQAAPITIGQVFLTTMLNPKAPIIGLVIMPHGTLAEITPALGLFSLLVLTAGTSFLTLGHVVGKAPVLSPRLVYRIAAVFLLLFSAGLVGSASNLI
ncbi:LysE family translocator [Shinella zoogloeoides]|uniref:LysE family translocator n=1 Tax=Shinella zoogloeoides TaxID=352475 RepID=UPI001F59BEEA|nr:LysE family transporter [Shinella zoogloeoides]